MIGPIIVPEKYQTSYRVTLVQPGSSGVLLYPISIRTRLPTIKIPLRPHDPPAKLNLQGLMEKVYAMGRYDRIDYGQPCSPPFDGPDKEWVDGILRAVGDRSA